MNKCQAIVAASVASGAIAAPSAADFVGIVCRPFVGDGWVEHGYADLTTYRLRAIFDNGLPEQDGVVSVYGLEDVPLSVRSSDGTFHNDAQHDSLTEPEDLRAQGIWSNQWDTYLTVGWWYGAPGDNTIVTPGFGEETNHLQTDWVTEHGGYWPEPCDFNMCAGRTNGYSSILLMQLTVAEGESVSGIINFYRAATGEIEGLLFSPAPPCPADVDESGTVDLSDLLLLLASWGPCSGCVEDLDGNGVVEFADLLLVLGMWGACP